MNTPIYHCRPGNPVLSKKNTFYVAQKVFLKKVPWVGVQLMQSDIILIVTSPEKIAIIGFLIKRHL